ncbi:MAG: DNA polymerase Y family protein [Planctomycetaceae bacterium]
MRRVICVWFPEWPVQRVKAMLPEPDRRRLPIVLYHDDGRGGCRVAACCPATARRGVAAGMSLAEAQGVLGTSRRQPPRFLPYDPREDALALKELAIWAGGFSPTVGIVGEAAVALEVSGCSHLFGGEQAMSRRLQEAVRQRGLFARLGFADTLGTAWAVAECAAEACTLVPSGAEAAALCSLPVRALRVSHTTLELLEELGLRSIGQVLELPRSSLPARFGKELGQRLDQALGQLPEPIEPIVPPQPVEARWNLEYPTSDRRAVEILVGRLLEQLLASLRDAGRGIQQLELRLVNASRESLVLPLGLVSPTRSAAHLFDLLKTRLEQVPLPQEVVSVQLEVTLAAPLHARPLRLFESEATGGTGPELACLVDRLLCRLGRDRVVRAVPQADPQPERAIVWQSWLDRSAESGVSLDATTNVDDTASTGQQRPLRLYHRPIAISVVWDQEQLRLEAFCRESAEHMVSQAWGPERITTGWWRGHPIARDYYRVETTDSRRYWLFRRLRQQDWFLHGEFG